MANMKKGYFYTLGFLLVAGLILAFALLFYRNSLETREVFSEVSAMNNADELVISIQQSIKKIFNLESGITLNSADFSIKENLPSSDDDDFKDRMDEFKSFVEAQDLGITLDIVELKSNLELKIMPQNISYTHSPTYGDNVIFIDGRTDGGNPYFTNYNLDVTTISADIYCTTSGTSTLLALEASGSSGSCIIGLGSSRIEMFDGSDVSIAIFQVAGEDLTITASSSISVKTVFSGLDTTLGNTHISLKEKVIDLDLSDFDLQQNTGVTLL